ncbi:MAG: hypothetical protein J1E85_10095 [Ruminococcus sp.]|nr:hypothetical protein [Ruminococcus sp.]
MTDLIIFWGGVAGSITAILVLTGMIFPKLKKILKMFNEMKEHTSENYLNNLRLVIMSNEMPIEERLRAGEKYIKAGGNGQVKAFYKKLQKEYLEREEI